ATNRDKCRKRARGLTATRSNTRTSGCPEPALRSGATTHCLPGESFRGNPPLIEHHYLFYKFIRFSNRPNLRKTLGKGRSDKGVCVLATERFNRRLDHLSEFA